MRFRQIFDPTSSSYTYFLADKNSGEAVLIDPLASHLPTYLTLLATEGCVLKYALETHVHADHLTACGPLRQLTGAQTGINAQCGVACADMQLQHGQQLSFGAYTIHVIGTPGHTPGSTSFLVGDRLFSGDALLINGCGRTDFQGGDAGAQYDSITQRLFTLPDATLVYPGHDYHGRQVSTIGHERASNARLAGKTRAQFIDIMGSLNLPRPELMDVAVPANRMCGLADAAPAPPHG